MLRPLQRDIIWFSVVRSFSLQSLQRIHVKHVNYQIDSPREKFVYPQRPTYQKICHFSEPMEHPWDRVKRAFRYDYEMAKSKWTDEAPPQMSTHGSDIVIIGGGILGSCIAHSITAEVRDACSITVIEKDPPECSTSMRIGSNGLYYNIPCKNYLEMTKYALEFYHKLSVTYGNPDISPTNLDFLPNSSLQLVSEKGASILEDLSTLYNDMSIKHELLSLESLKLRYPWLNTDGIALGCLGMQGEGMFNQQNIIRTMRERAQSVGATFVRGNVTGFRYKNLTDIYGGINEDPRLRPMAVAIETPEGDLQFHHFCILIVAAGPATSDILNLMIKRHNWPLPIESRKRYMYSVHCPNGPGIDSPMVIDPNGLSFRRNGLTEDYTVWKDPSPENDVSCKNLDINELYFQEEVLPTLLRRAPVFETAKLTASEAGLIDINVWDRELVVGSLMDYSNINVAAGCGCDEFLFAPAIGRYFMENIAHTNSNVIDFSVFGMERFYSEEKLERVQYS